MTVKDVETYFTCLDEEGNPKGCPGFWQVEIRGFSPTCPKCSGHVCLPTEPPAQAEPINPTPVAEAAGGDDGGSPPSVDETNYFKPVVVPAGLQPVKRKPGRPRKNS